MLFNFLLQNVVLRHVAPIVGNMHSLQYNIIYKCKGSNKHGTNWPSSASLCATHGPSIPHTLRDLGTPYRHECNFKVTINLKFLLPAQKLQFEPQYLEIHIWSANPEKKSGELRRHKHKCKDVRNLRVGGSLLSLRIGATDGAFVNRVMNLRFHKREGIWL